MNLRALKRRLDQYGLRRRNQGHSEHTVREIVKHEKLRALPRFLDIVECGTS